MIQALLAKYAMQLLGGLLAIAILTGGYYYWKHSVASEAHKECNVAWEERDRKDIMKAVEIQASENAKIDIIKQFYEDRNNESKSKLNDYIETITADNAAANAAVARLRNYKATRAVSCENRMPTQANDTGGIGGTGNENIQTAVSLKAVEIIIEDYVKKYFTVVE